jgi:hypothetical protein
LPSPTRRTTCITGRSARHYPADQPSHQSQVFGDLVPDDVLGWLPFVTELSRSNPRSSACLVPPGDLSQVGSRRLLAPGRSP